MIIFPRIRDMGMRAWFGKGRDTEGAEPLLRRAATLNLHFSVAIETSSDRLDIFYDVTDVKNALVVLILSNNCTINHFCCPIFSPEKNRHVRSSDLAL